MTQKVPIISYYYSFIYSKCSFFPTVVILCDSPHVVPGSAILAIILFFGWRGAWVFLYTHRLLAWAGLVLIQPALHIIYYFVVHLPPLRCLHFSVTSPISPFHSFDLSLSLLFFFPLFYNSLPCFYLQLSAFVNLVLRPLCAMHAHLYMHLNNSEITLQN